MRQAALAALLLAALAGCASPAAPPGAPAPAPVPDAPREAEVAQSGCTVLEVLVRVPEATARALVPEHFTPVASEGQVAAAVGAAACGAEGGGRAFFALSVEPAHDALRAEGVDRSFYEPDHAALPEGALAQALRDAGLRGVPPLSSLAVSAGPTAVQLASEGPGAAFSARTATGVLPGRFPGSGGVFREYFAAEGGYGYFQASYGDMSDFALSPATFEAGEGTAARRALGPSGQGAGVAFERLTFDDARVGFVPVG